jgi:hypothetical protein
MSDTGVDQKRQVRGPTSANAPYGMSRFFLLSRPMHTSQNAHKFLCRAALHWRNTFEKRGDPVVFRRCAFVSRSEE